MDFLEDMTFLLILMISGLLCYTSLRMFWGRRNLPPGPTPLPVLGSALQLRGGSVVSSLLKLRDTYGDAFTIYMGSRPLVVVSGFKLVKEVYVDRADDFLSRGDVIAMDSTYKNYGIAFTSDVERWREIRRFSVTTMRDFGMGKRSIEERIQDEARCLVEEIRITNESVLDPQKYFMKASANVIFSIMFGNRHDYEDAELHGVLNCMTEIISVWCSHWGQMFEMFPTIMQFLPGKHQEIVSNMEKLMVYVKKRVENNWKTLDLNNPRDYVDAFLIKMEKEKNNPQTEFHLTNLVCSTLQIFFAGIETTSTTLVYSLLVLMKYPDVLDKVYKEIDHVIGRNRSPKQQDRIQMPFTEAVIHELQRFIDFLPTGLARKTTKDVEFHGNLLPKGTNVLPMITTVLKDPNFFPYPDEFNPKNFLDENEEFTKNEAFIPLAAGKRNCMGEALARMEVFLFIVTTLQNFSLKPEIPRELLDVSPGAFGFANTPKPFKMSFIPR